MRRILLLLGSHGAALLLGFALGVYLLPILTAPEAPAAAEARAATAEARFTGRFDPDLEGSDLVHWGEGEVRIGTTHIAHIGRLAPGPDYRLYLAPDFVATKEAFLALKARAVQVGEVKTFSGFLLPIPPGVDPAAHTTVVVWCEAFSQFITAARYR
jgi:hypothetical protein